MTTGVNYTGSLIKTNSHCQTVPVGVAYANTHCPMIKIRILESVSYYGVDLLCCGLYGIDLLCYGAYLMCYGVDLLCYGAYLLCYGIDLLCYGVDLLLVKC